MSFCIDTTNSEEKLSRSTFQPKTQKKSFWEDGFLKKYYLCEIEIPDKEEYKDMLSCIEDILKDLKVLKEPWKSLSCLNRNSAYYIPIKLVDEKELPDDPIKEDGTISPDTLGAYRSCDDQKLPIILLWPDKILEAAKDLEEAKILCKKVIIHEFAHALMDPHNWNKNNEFAPTQKNQCQKITSDADRFMEESLANMLTLQYFNEVAEQAKKNAENAVKSKNEDLKNAANDLERAAKEKEAQKVEDFITYHQPSIYRFGITQFELNTDWRKWRDYKANKTPDFWSYWAGLFAGKKIQ